MNTKLLEIVGGLLGSMFFRKEPGVKEVVKHDTETQARIPFYRYLGTWIGTFTALSGGLGLMWVIPPWEWAIALLIAGIIGFVVVWWGSNDLAKVLVGTPIFSGLVVYGVTRPDQFWIDNWAWIFGSAALLSLVLAGALYAWQQGREQAQVYQPMPEHLWAKSVIEDLLESALPKPDLDPGESRIVRLEVVQGSNEQWWDVDPDLLLEFSQAILGGGTIAYSKWRKRFEDWPGGYKQFRSDLVRVGAIKERGARSKAEINRAWFEKAVEALA